MTMKVTTTIVLLALLSASCFSVAFAQTPEDTYIWEGNPSTSYGSATTITVDDNNQGNPTYGLLKFHGLEISAGNTLVSATLRLRSVDASPGTISAYRMIDTWSDSSTWSQFHNGRPVHESAPSFRFEDPDENTVMEFNVYNDVEGWLSSPNTNQGWLFTNDSGNGWDFASAESASPPELVIVTQPTRVEIGRLITRGNFNSGTEGFTYISDPFFNTNNPDYASGENTNGRLVASVGGIDNKQIEGMSAGWKYDFTLTQSARVQVVFDWTLTFGFDYEWDEYIEMVVSLDGEETIIENLIGDGNGGEDHVASGNGQIINWVGVSAGTHTIALGIYNNMKTSTSESARVEIDNVIITRFTALSASSAAPTLSPLTSSPVAFSPVDVIVDANFEEDTEGFVYQDDTFKNTNNPDYAFGWRVPDNIFSGSAGLQVRLGGTDNREVTGMSGGWAFTFYLAQPSTIDLVFDWELFLDSGYENNEFGEVIVSLDGSERVIVKLLGDGNGGSNTVTRRTADDSQSWLNVGAGSHTIILGGYNNKKTHEKELTRIRLDHIKIIAHANGPPPPTEAPSATPTISPNDSPTTNIIGETPVPTSFPSSAPTGWPTSAPTVSPTDSPTSAPAATRCPNGPATYSPGDLTVTLDDDRATDTLLASAGLNGRVLTRIGQPVQYDEGGQSSATIHSRADSAGVVPDDSNPNRYYLVSNSESGSGGVGILHFDASFTPHRVIGYRRTGEGTNTGSRNCGGGRTPWGTWLSSEESRSGTVNEIDPNDPSTGNSNCRDGGNCCRTPIVPAEGGNYESNAFWVSPSENKYHFYTTEDASSNYRLTRFVPDDDINTMLAKPRKLDRLCGASGQLHYLQLRCTANCGTNRPSGTYSWSTSRTPASGDQAYPNAEGIDVKGNDLYFVTKNQRRLYIVDLAGSTWRSGETIQSNSGETFSPDQITRITGSNSPNDILYFTEDGSGTQDIHARGMDSEGAYRFFTIVRGYSSSETVGLTFSLDNKMMYFAHQDTSEIWQIWRNDGCSFGDGNYLDVNYHAVDPFRMLRGAKVPEVESGSAEIFV